LRAAPSGEASQVIILPGGLPVTGKAVASICLFSLVCCAAPPAAALGLNAFRAAEHRRPLHQDRVLAALARRHAVDLARRNHLDHDGFVSERVRGGARAENVSYGCSSQDCAIRQWSRSWGHRANMLRADVHGYGLASAVSSSGRRYWVLIVGR
jgi:uncharacterized protein YkwD